jgi:hypothetical protein
MRYVVGVLIVFAPLFGLVFIVVGVRGLWTTWKRRPFLRPADGIIIGVQEERVTDDDGHDQEWKYRPILRYTTETGEVKEFVSETGQIGRESPYREGTQLPVLYDPDGVLPPRINSWFALWGTQLILIAVGPVFIGCGALIYLVFGQRVLHGE